MSNVHVDPYKFFFDKYQENIDVNPENVVIYNADKEWLQAEFDRILNEAAKTRHSWVVEAMRNDPAFMVDPINDYYLKLIPDNIKEHLDEEKLVKILEILDPITWAERNLLQKHGGFKARTSRLGFPYQAQMIRCKSKRIAVRAGRRIGKSVSLVVRLLHKVYTWTPNDNQPTFDIVIFTPNQSQIDMLFKMIEVLIDGNEKLMAFIPDGKIPTRKNPFHILEFKNKASIKGFVSGSTAIRGQRADVLVLDEGSFLTPDDIDSVVALLAERPDVEFWISSTPKGPKDYFYERCMDPNFVEFYFPTDKYHPDWNQQMENEFKGQLTEQGYKYEVLADFADDGVGVFQRQYIEMAFDNYLSYSQMLPEPGYIYALGVDWNDPDNGTQLYVVGYNIEQQRYKVVAKESISIQGWTQLTAVRRIRELNRKWKFDIIYVDYGHGGTQVEMLHEIGLKAPKNSLDKRLIKAKAINFSSTVTVYDPWQKREIKKPLKPYMVNLFTRVLEQGLIDIPHEDEILKKQMIGYHIERFTPAGIPVYGKDEKVGDHALDALMLAILGFNMEYNPLHKPRLANKMQNIDSVLFKKVDIGNSNKLSPTDLSLLRDKEFERQEYLNAHGIKYDPNYTTINPRRNTPIGTFRLFKEHAKRSKF